MSSRLLSNLYAVTMKRKAPGDQFMPTRRLYALPFSICFCAVLLCSALARAADAPRPLPVGLDAYRAWDRWDEQKIGMRAYMRSTYDKIGRKAAANAAPYLYQV